MIVLEPDDLEHGIVLNTAQALDNDQYYAMVDLGTNAIIVPLHPGMRGEIAECQVRSATVAGPIVQVYELNGARRLVVALPNSAILVSQEWLTAIAGWTPTQALNPDCRTAHVKIRCIQLLTPILVKRVVLESHEGYSSKGHTCFRTYME